MSDDTFDLNCVRTEQKAMEQYGRLHWAHWLILAISVVVTFAAWNFSNTMLQSRKQGRFDREANLVVAQVRERLAHYEDALIGAAAALLASNGEFTQRRWREYATALDLPNRYPGVSGIGVIEEFTKGAEHVFIGTQTDSHSEFQIRPEHDFPVKLPIVFIEPMESNAAAFGLDVAHEENRRNAALLARDTATPQISGPITLAQDDGKTPGFLFYEPFYFDGIGFGGLVYAPLVVKNLIAGVLGDSERHVSFSIRDGGKTIYDGLSQTSDVESTEYFETEITSHFYGRNWIFSIQSTYAFSGSSSSTQPTVVLFSGLTIDVLLLLIFIMMTRSNRKILSLADTAINRIAEQTHVLSRKNSDLENFAHIVSHDLKTPIRAIHALSDFIEEDMDDLVSDEETKNAIKLHTKRINEQVERSDSLISGILNFSAVGHIEENQTDIDITAMIMGITKSLNIPDKQIAIAPAMPTLHSYPVQLTQVFENLIGNAYKYHPVKNKCQIAVTVQDNDPYYRFTVLDNGDGIDPEFHDSVFNPFVTLQTVPSADTSGIGLSIVQKTVSIFEGDAGIDQNYKDGASFYFDWPKQHTLTQQRVDRAA